MMLPSPDNPQNAPVWENYIVAQAVQASLGLVPLHAVAIGVEVDDVRVWLRSQLAEVSEQDVVDLEDIRGNLQDLVANDVEGERSTKTSLSCMSRHEMESVGYSSRARVPQMQ